MLGLFDHTKYIGIPTENKRPCSRFKHLHKTNIKDPDWEWAKQYALRTGKIAGFCVVDVGREHRRQALVRPRVHVSFC